MCQELNPIKSLCIICNKEPKYENLSTCQNSTCIYELKRRQRIIKKYEKLMKKYRKRYKLCPVCGKKMDYNDRKKHCSRPSCIRRIKLIKAKKIYDKQEKQYCIYCNKLLPKYKKKICNSKKCIKIHKVLCIKKILERNKNKIPKNNKCKFDKWICRWLLRNNDGVLNFCPKLNKEINPEITERCDWYGNKKTENLDTSIGTS